MAFHWMVQCHEKHGMYWIIGGFDLEAMVGVALGHDVYWLMVGEMWCGIRLVVHQIGHGGSNNNNNSMIIAVRLSHRGL